MTARVSGTLIVQLGLCLVGGAWAVPFGHYEILGIHPDATLHEIQRAYRRTALLEHPDKSDAPDADARFRRVALAFEVLSDRERRAAYDRGYGETSGQTGTQMDPYELFKNHVGDVYQHWRPGYRVEGDVLRNSERVRILLHPDGSSEVREAEDTGMHHFQRLEKTGWCLFRKEPRIMVQAGTDEVACRQKCVDLAPSCEGYAFEQVGGSCELYKRDDPPERIAAADGSAGVTCYQQDDKAFDTSSSVLHSTITVTAPDGSKSGFTRRVFCQHREVTRGIAPAPSVVPTVRVPWWAGLAAVAQRIARRLA